MSEAVYMRLFMRIFVCIFFLLALSACGAGQFGKTYRGYLTPEEAADVVMLGEGQEPNLIRSDDIDRDVRFYREHNYIVIGESSFNGVQENPENAVRQAEEVKATHVIVSSAYTDTESRVDYDYQDVYSTVFVNRVANIDGQEVNVQESVMVRDTVSVPYMRQYDNFDQWAVYMVKSNRVHKLGILLRDLDQQDRGINNRNTGTVIDIVLASSPAYLADIVPGDVLTAINGEKIIDTRHAIDLIGALELSGQTVLLSIVKQGVERDISLEFSE